MTSFGPLLTDLMTSLGANTHGMFSGWLFALNPNLTFILPSTFPYIRFGAIWLALRIIVLVTGYLFPCPVCRKGMTKKIRSGLRPKS